MHHQLSPVKIAFQELLATELNTKRFTKGNIYDIPFAILSFARTLSGFVRKLETNNVKDSPQELEQIVEKLKTVIIELSAICSGMIVKMEEKNYQPHTVFTAGDNDDLGKTCADKFNETNEKGLKEIREADGAWQTAKEILEWGDDLIDTGKWCLDKLFGESDKND